MFSRFAVMANRLLSSKRLRGSCLVADVVFIVCIAVVWWTGTAGVWHTAAVVAEPRTGAEFPDALGNQVLVAVGAKRKLLTKPYAIGLYLHERSRLWGHSSDSDSVIYFAPGKVSLRLVITSRFVTKEKLAAAFRAGLESRLTWLSEARRLELLDEVERAITDGPTLLKRTEIHLIFWRRSIEFKIGPNYRTFVTNSALGTALLEMYLDENALIPAFKYAILLGLRAKH